MHGHLGGDTLVAQGAERRRLVPGGEPLPCVIGDQAMMVVARNGQVEERLQETMNMGGGHQVEAARDQSHAL